MSVYQTVNRVKVFYFHPFAGWFLDMVDNKHQGLEWNVANIRFDAKEGRFRQLDKHG